MHDGRVTVEWKGPSWMQWAKEREWPLEKVFNRVTEVELRGSYVTEANLARLKSFSQLQHLRVGPARMVSQVALNRLKVAQPGIEVESY